MTQRTIPNPYQHLYRILIITAFLMNIPAVFLMMSGNRQLTMLLGLSQFGMFFAGVVFLIQGKKIVRDTLHLLNGELLAEWTYETFHWTTYAAKEYARLRNNAVIAMAAVLLTLPAAAWFGIGGMSVTDGMMLGTILGAATYGIMTFHAKSVRKRSGRPPFEAFFGMNGAFINGVLIDWSERGTELKNISHIRDNRETGETIQIQYTVRSVNGIIEQVMTAPVPAGKSQEASSLAARITATRKR